MEGHLNLKFQDRPDDEGFSVSSDIEFEAIDAMGKFDVVASAVCALGLSSLEVKELTHYLTYLLSMAPKGTEGLGWILGSKGAK